jgi:hypothetical protein
MKEFSGNSFKLNSQIVNKGGIESLPLQWAKKYLQNLEFDADDENNNTQNLVVVVSQAGKSKNFPEIDGIFAKCECQSLE